MKFFVTGGAGFIGSHMVDRLLREKHDVLVYDNFSTGRELFIAHHKGDAHFRTVTADILDTKKLQKAMKGHDVVFHFQANADVRRGIESTQKDFDQNIVGTYNVLESMRVHGITKILFASSATVYGEPSQFPTPEEYPLIQTSMYGASKASAEHMIEAYSEYYGIQSWIFRFVSFIGERYTHGVICDFMKKLQKDPTHLEILGDGTQKKSYLYVADGIDAMMTAFARAKGTKNIFNIGHKDYIDVVTVADLIGKTLNFKQVKYSYTGGKRGWIGDSPFVHLDVRKLEGLGWHPRVTIPEGIVRTVEYLKEHPELFVQRKD
ncbi:NAD-dependent epimerase/dehydratase family protein [Candidatus Woesearchaeota archaeon]|nr:NAD-dependent epimerase/dehydratase family protein [Candidatus Woesearchaeota archaeon]